MKKSQAFLTLDADSGEFLYQGGQRRLRKKYRPDTPFDLGFVPYLVLLFCGTVDATIFISLFQQISYDSPLMICVEVGGFIFGFDVIPLYMGIQLKRVKEGLDSSRFLLWMAFAAFALACGLNICLRLLTIEELSPELAFPTGYGLAAGTAAENGPDPEALSLTLFSVVMPLVTSIGSFFISFVTYKPLKIRLRRYEEMLDEKRDQIRRLDGFLAEYEGDPAFEEELRRGDEGRLEEMRRTQKALVCAYCDHVRQRLKEHLADPASTSALSESACQAVLERLERELAALYGEGEAADSRVELKTVAPSDSEAA